MKPKIYKTMADASGGLNYAMFDCKQKDSDSFKVEPYQEGYVIAIFHKKDGVDKFHDYYREQ